MLFQLNILIHVLIAYIGVEGIQMFLHWESSIKLNQGT